MRTAAVAMPCSALMVGLSVAAAADIARRRRRATDRLGSRITSMRPATAARRVDSTVGNSSYRSNDLCRLTPGVIRAEPPARRMGRYGPSRCAGQASARWKTCGHREASIHCRDVRIQTFRRVQLCNDRRPRRNSCSFIHSFIHLRTQHSN